MELFKILGTIAINSKDANKALDEVSDKGEKSHSKLSGAFSKIGDAAVKVGKTVAVGLGAAATAVAGLVTKSVQSYAEYEQLIGGVETLFSGTKKSYKELYDEMSAQGKSLDEINKKWHAYQKGVYTVTDNAAEAYKTAGMSANDYMSTVTSFSASLIQSLGGDTAKSAEYAHQAIVDMSDNANKMGTDISMIQNAYQGFAKQNYTMLDNLKLGYGGTKEEMQRLLADAEKLTGKKFDLSSFADITEAIHAIQTEMGITGTTAREAASTIEGSLNMTKAAWQNLLTGMADEEADFEGLIGNFVDSVGTFADNIVPRIMIALDGVSMLVTKLGTKLMQMLPDMISELLPTLVDASVNLLNAFVAVMPNIVSALMNALPALIDGVTQLVIGLMDSVGIFMDRILEGIALAVPSFINGIVEIIKFICEDLTNVIEVIITYVPWILEEIVTAIAENLPIIIEGLIALCVDLVQYMPTIISALLNDAGRIVSLIVAAILENLPVLIDGLIELVGAIVTAMPEILSGLMEAIPNLFEGIKEAINSVFGNLDEVKQWASEHETALTVIGIAFGTLTAAVAAYNAVQAIKRAGGVLYLLDLAKTAIGVGALTVAENAHTVATTIATTATTAFGAVLSFLTSPVTLVVAAIGALIAIGVLLYKNWDEIKAKAIEVWTAIKDWFTEVWGKIKDYFIDIWTTAKDKFTEIWNAITDFLSTAWETIKNVVTVGVMFIGEILSAAFQIITLPFKFIWENCKEYVFAAFEWIKEKINVAITKIKEIAQTGFNFVKEKIITPITEAKDKVVEKFNELKEKAQDKITQLKNKATETFNSIKEKVITPITNAKNKVVDTFNDLRSKAQEKINSLKEKVTSTFNTIKEKIQTPINNAKNKVTEAFNTLKSNLTSKIDDIKSKVTSKFNDIKQKITEPIEKAKNKVKEMIDKIKGFFDNLKLKFPNIKLPHFKISGDFSLDPPSVPKFSIEWYKKAMNAPMLLNDPTIFGYNPATGQMRGAGEAGEEVVSGASALMRMIKGAVNSELDGVAYYLQKLISMLADYFPELIAASGHDIVCDDGTIIARYTPMIDKRLGDIQKMKKRGR